MSATPTTREVLVKARAWFDAPEKWTQGAMWRTATGKDTGSKPDVAKCCGYGAVELAGWSLSNRKTSYPSDAVWEARDLLDDVVSCDFAVWNDAPGRTFSDITSAFDRAIALASTEASS